MDLRHRGEGSARLLTPEELAERLQVPLSTLYQWASRGTGPRRLKVGRHNRYREADVRAWEDEQYVAG